MTATPDLKPLAPLARTIADTVRDTPIRLGSPDGAAHLVAELTVKVAAYVGHELGPDAKVLGEVQAERDRQDAKWGEQNHPDGTGLHPERQKMLADEAKALCDRAFREGFGAWSHILWEEVREAMAEEDPVRLREELIQVAAVAVNWIGAIDRRTERTT